MQHDKIKALDRQIEELQKKKAILILEQEIESIKKATIVPRIIYQDVYVPRIQTYPVWPQYHQTGPWIVNNGSGVMPLTNMNNTMLCATNTAGIFNT